VTAFRPAVFIGSSVEGLDVAYALQENLEYDAEPTVWSQDVFKPSQTTLKDLADEANRTDFAIFAFTPDDMRVMRGEQTSVPRDNVIFELGLFMGALGVERCFFVSPRMSEPLAIPSDLLGVTSLNYDAARSDGRLTAALGPAAHKVRNILRRLGSKPRVKSPPAIVELVDRTDYFIERWNAAELLKSREILRASIPLHGFEDEDGVATQALKTVFVFLESFADALLAGEIDEHRARAIFDQPIKTVWNHARIYLAPLNSADEWWDPLPKLAELDLRWKALP
jgi:hypothetical protein